MKINANELCLPGIEDNATGLTKLEWAAVQIMVGMCANNSIDATWESRAPYAIKAARALFAELEKDNG